jgi:hypothetical protein
MPARYAEAACAAIGDCFGPLLDLWMAGEDCVEHFRTALEDELPLIEDAIEDGRVVYDGRSLLGCTNELTARGCAAITEREHAACTATLDGTVPLGEPCTMSAECKGKAYCKTDQSCPGVCTGLEPATAACDKNEHCKDGLLCSDDTKRCYAPSELGESCGGGIAPDCTPGLVCVGESDESGRAGTCRTIDQAFSAAVGESCSFETGPLCSPELACAVTGLDGLTAVTECVAIAASGGDCHPGFPNPCPVGQYCKTTLAAPFDGTCTAAPSAGEPCARGPFGGVPSICVPDTRCENGTCQALRRAGGSCSIDDVCYSENCVDGVCLPGSSCQ